MTSHSSMMARPASSHAVLNTDQESVQKQTPDTIARNDIAGPATVVRANFSDYSAVPVSQEGDAIEREADEAAEKAIRGEVPRINPIRKLQVSARGESDRKLATHVNRNFKHVHAGGRPMPESVQQNFEGRFRQDFSQVRIHNDMRAHQLAAGANARALSYGQNIYFAQNAWKPNSHAGQSLLAHELAHTVQQQKVSMINRRVDRPEPTTPDSDTDNSSEVDSAAQTILADLANDPTDSDGGVARTLRQLDPITRLSVASRVRGQLPEDQRQQFEESLATASTQENKNPQADPEATGGQDQSSHQQPEATAAAQEQEPEQRARRNVAEAQAQAQIDPNAEQPPVPASSQDPLQERAVEAEAASEQSMQENAEVGQEAADESDEAREISEEDTEAAAEDAQQEQEQESDEGDDQDAAPTTLRELMEPPPDPQQAEAAVGQQGEQQQAVDDYDETAALSAVESYVQEIQGAAEAAEQTISTAAGSARATITGAANAAREDVEVRVAAASDAIAGLIGECRSQIGESFTALEQSISGEFEARQSETRDKGAASQGRFRGKFSQHRVNVNDTVDDKVDAANELTDNAVEAVETRTDEQAEIARRRGRNRGALYGNDEKGIAQYNAVVGVANRTASEIEGNKPETVQAIREITEDIPTEFRQKGREALTGYDNGLPDLLAQVDTQVESMLGQLQTHHNSTREQLTAKHEQAMTKLESLQASVMVQVEAVIPQAHAQISAAEAGALAKVDSGVRRSLARIRSVAEEGVQLLNEAETPDVDNAGAMKDQVVSFLSDAAAEAVASLGQGVGRISREFSSIADQVQTGLDGMKSQTQSDLDGISNEANDAMLMAETGINDAFTNSMQQFDSSISDAETEVETKLSQAISDLAAEMDGPLGEARVEVANARREGLAKNDEALADLNAQMREAASDAAWEVDHPVLSTIADIGAIVAGVIAGILLVIALVVVVIVGFKLIIAGLVALGVSVAVAKFIVAVAAIGLLAYGIYTAYQETGSIGGAILTITGIQGIINSFSQEGLSPFERGFAFGQGIGTLATFFIGRGMGKSINARFARIGRLPNPSGLGRIGRLMHFAENLHQPGARGAFFTQTGPGRMIAGLANRTGIPQALSNAGTRIAQSRAGTAIGNLAQSGANRVGQAGSALYNRGAQALETLGNTRVGQAIQGGVRRLGGIQNKIDEGVEATFSGLENSRAGQRAGNYLFGRSPTNPAPGAGSRPGPITRQDTPAAANDNAVPTPANDNAISGPQRPAPGSAGSSPAPVRRQVGRGRQNAGSGYTEEGNLITPDRFRRPGPQRPAPAQPIAEEVPLARTGTDNLPVRSAGRGPNRPQAVSNSGSANASLAEPPVSPTRPRSSGTGGGAPSRPGGGSGGGGRRRSRGVTAEGVGDDFRYTEHPDTSGAVVQRVRRPRAAATPEPATPPARTNSSPPRSGRRQGGMDLDDDLRRTLNNSAGDRLEGAQERIFPTRDRRGVHTDRSGAAADRAALEQGSPSAGRVRSSKIRSSHDLGVEGGRARARQEGIVVDEGWNPPQRWTDEYGRGFDDVGRRGARRIIVEHKGEGSSLSRGQMSNEAVGRRIARLEMAGDPMAAELLQAARSGNLQGVVYRTRTLPSGEVVTTRVRSVPGARTRHGLIQYAPSYVERAYQREMAELTQLIQRATAQGLDEGAALLRILRNRI